MHERRKPDKLPDPWLFNTEKLLHELDNCRELILKIPVRDSEVHFATNRAIDALWDLRSTIEFLLQLHRSGQRAFGEKAMELQKQTPIRPTKEKPVRTEANDIDTSLRRTGKPCRNPDLRTDEEKAHWQHIRAQLALKRRQQRLAARGEESTDPTAHQNVIRLKT
jgi:hypothetical protein